MGGLVSAPLQWLGSCLGACSGTCLTLSCFKLADSGTVSTALAARCVLAWLQIFCLLFVWLVSRIPPKSWKSPCQYVDLIGAGDFGICECQVLGNEPGCWLQQSVLRASAAAFLVYAVLLILSVSGCALGAARFHEVGKFMSVVIMWSFFLFLPNGIFRSFGWFTSVCAVFFLLTQVLLVIDLAYRCNELMYAKAISAHRQLDETLRKAWLGAILAASLLALALAGALAAGAWLATEPGLSHQLLAAAAAASLLLLVVSITDWCSHGALLTSCVMACYQLWLAAEAAWNMEPADRSLGPKWVQQLRLGVRGAFVLAAIVALALGFCADEVASDCEGGAAEAGRQALLAAAAASDGRPSVAIMSDREKRSFVVQCAAHATIPLYVCAAWVANKNYGGIAAEVIVAVLCPLMYGWSLVAPQLMPNRRF